MVLMHVAHSNCIQPVLRHAVAFASATVQVSFVHHPFKDCIQKCIALTLSPLRSTKVGARAGCGWRQKSTTRGKVLAYIVLSRKVDEVHAVTFMYDIIR